MKKMLGIFISVPFIIGVLLIIYAGFGMAYLQERREQERLSHQIATIERILQKPQENKEDLKAQLAQVEAELEAVQRVFPKVEQSLELLNTTLELAQECGVEVSGITTKPLMTKKIGETEFIVLPLEVAAQGSLNKLLDFITELNEGAEPLQTLELEAVHIAQKKEQFAADLNIHIYLSETSG